MQAVDVPGFRLVALQYELALLVGQELRLVPMLRRFFPPALKSLGCKAAHVWLHNADTARLEARFTYPARDAGAWQTDPRFAAAATVLDSQPSRPRAMRIGDNTQLHILPLRGVGYCVLVREGEPLDAVMIKTLLPIFDRLATACRASLEHERVEHLRAIAAAGERRLRTVFETVGEVIFQTDEQGRLTFLNPAWSVVSGFEIAHCLGRPLTDFLSPEDVDRVREAFDCALDNNQDASLRFEARLNTPHDHPRWVVIRLKSIHRTEDGTDALTGTIIDVTDLKQAERMKREFTATVSHELRTPLTSITGAIGLLNGGAAGPLPDGVRELLAIAEKNSQRLRLLIDDLLDMEKLLAGKLSLAFEDLDLHPLLTQALSEHRTFAAAHAVRLTLSNHCGSARVHTDPVRFQQVMSNLLSNAVKFSPQGGEVAVTADRLEHAVHIEIRDQGPGIDPAFHHRIFEKFAQADGSDARSRGGTGLGLAITRELVEQMHGRIGFESTPGHGATFWFELPASC